MLFSAKTQSNPIGLLTAKSKFDFCHTQMSVFWVMVYSEWTSDKHFNQLSLHTELDMLYQTIGSSDLAQKITAEVRKRTDGQ